MKYMFFLSSLNQALHFCDQNRREDCTQKTTPLERYTLCY
jgi:hypothetical protein